MCFRHRFRHRSHHFRTAHRTISLAAAPACIIDRHHSHHRSHPLPLPSLSPSISLSISTSLSPSLAKAKALAIALIIILNRSRHRSHHCARSLAMSRALLIIAPSLCHLEPSCVSRRRRHMRASHAFHSLRRVCARVAGCPRRAATGQAWPGARAKDGMWAYSTHTPLRPTRTASKVCSCKVRAGVRRTVRGSLLRSR